MPSIRERIDAAGKKSYHVQVRLKGFPPQTRTFDSKTTAKQWGQHVEHELLAGRYMPHAVAQRYSVRQMLETYRDRVLIPLKPKRIRDQGQQVDWWIDKIGAYSLADISPAIIGKCRDELQQEPFGKKGQKKRAPATIVRYLALLSHAFNVAVREWEWLPESPMAKVKKPKIANGRVRYLTAEELERLRSAVAVSVNPFLATVVEVALATGLRYAELMTLKWGDVLLDPAEQHGTIVLETTKNGDRRGVPLTGRGLVAIHAIRQRHMTANKGKVNLTALLFPSAKKPTRPVELRKSWETALRRAEIDNFRWHDLRHTTASLLAMNGATGNEIAEILGHKDLQMVKRYAHLSKAHVAGVLTRMNEARLGAAVLPPAPGHPSSNRSADDKL